MHGRHPEYSVPPFECSRAIEDVDERQRGVAGGGTANRLVRLQMSAVVLWR